MICCRCLSMFRAARPLMQLTRTFTSSDLAAISKSRKEPTPNWSYLLDKGNISIIKANIESRKGIGNIEQVHQLYEDYCATKTEAGWKKLLKAALLIPNITSSHSPCGSEPIRIKVSGQAQDFKFRPRAYVDLMMRYNLLRYSSGVTSHLVFGTRSYVLHADLAALERSLIRWSLDRLKENGWNYIMAPDLLPESVINACGFVTTGPQNQIYKVKKEQDELCLAGTSEMSMAGLYAATSLDLDKPIKLCTYSPCFRAEEARNAIDKDFYRLHQFNKVEMFGICKPGESNSLLDEIVGMQQQLFSELGLCYKLLEMPSEELGAPAYRKFDIEAWMHGKCHWGEISSASNCTDYQSRRLNITTAGGDEFAHTVNGTGCALPRMLIAIVEHYQEENGTVNIPKCLQPYMNGREILRKHDRKLVWINSKPSQFKIDSVKNDKSNKHGLKTIRSNS